MTNEELYQHREGLWDRLYSISLGMLTPVDDPTWQSFPYMDNEDRASWIGLVELRTIHLGVGRQTGKTSWLIKMLKERPNPIMICRDKWERDQVIKQAGGAPLYGRVFTMSDLRSIGAKELLAKLGMITHLLIDQGVCQRQLGKFFDEVLEPSVTVVVMH